MTDEAPYPDNVKTASEFLRLTIALLMKHKIPAHPDNYQMGYEYVSGRNIKLTEGFNKLVEQDSFPSENQLHSLYKHYFLQDEASLEAMRQEIRHIIINLLEEFGCSGSKLSSYTQTLNQFINILDNKNIPADMLDETQKVLNETHDMGESQQRFEKQMKDVVSEIDSLKKELEQVKEESKTDTLTGISNRKAFDMALEHSIVNSRESNKPFSLLLLDIDHFKAFNDNYGHLIGDKVLRYVAASLKRNVKGNDFVARFGGEEFAIILPATSINGAITVAEQIRDAISSGKLKDNATDTSYGKLTISIGVSQFRASDLLNELLERVDKALYLAKEHGRNRVEKL